MSLDLWDESKFANQHYLLRRPQPNVPRRYDFVICKRSEWAWRNDKDLLKRMRNAWALPAICKAANSWHLAENKKELVRELLSIRTLWLFCYDNILIQREAVLGDYTSTYPSAYTLSMPCFSKRHRNMKLRG
jgi:hypothetical protein